MERLIAFLSVLELVNNLVFLVVGLNALDVWMFTN